MPARIVPQGISTHPQLQRMIEAHLAGQSSREIARWSSPQVAHNTISQYLKSRVRPAIENAAQLLAVVPPRTEAVREEKKRESSLGGSPELSSSQDCTGENRQPERLMDQQPEQLEQNKQVERLAVTALAAAPVLSLFRQRLEKLHGRVDRLLDRAEEAVKVVPDEEGNLCAVGKDLGVAAPLLAQAHKNLEILGRATGELEPQGSGAISVQIVCPWVTSDPNNMPKVSYSAPDQIEEDDETVIGFRQG